jgi:hypothetical protein
MHKLILFLRMGFTFTATENTFISINKYRLLFGYHPRSIADNRFSDARQIIHGFTLLGANYENRSSQTNDTLPLHKDIYLSFKVMKQWRVTIPSTRNFINMKKVFRWRRGKSISHMESSTDDQNGNFMPDLDGYSPQFCLYIVPCWSSAGAGNLGSTQTSVYTRARILYSD